MTATVIDHLRDKFQRIESDIADGPLVPPVSPEEIRDYLISKL